MDKCHLPPGPRHPAAFQGAWLTYRPFDFLEWCRNHHGETFTLKLPALGRVPIFTRPQDIERIFELDGGPVSGGEAQSPLVDFAGDRSLMKLDGTAHRDHREVLCRALKPSELPNGGDLLLEQVREAVASWPVGKRFELGRALDRLALMLVSELALGEAPLELIAYGREDARRLATRSAPHGLDAQGARTAQPIWFSVAEERGRALPRNKVRSQRTSSFCNQVMRIRPHGGCVLAAWQAARR